MIQAIASPPRSVTGRWRSLLVVLGRRVAERIALYHRRAMSRRALRELDAHLLEDIGLGRDAALREAMKPFWRA